VTGRWRKLGRIYDPGARTDRHPKLATHAANPLAVHMDADVFRVFYSGRDAENRSSVGAVDIDIARRAVIAEITDPVLEHGPQGSFHADGISIGCIYETGGTRYILFMAWQTPPGAHWRGDIGRIVLDDDMSMRIDGDGPFLGADDDADPVSLSYPWVHGDAARGFRMWYGSTVSWDAGNGEMLHVLNGATSRDGHHWTRLGPSVPYAIGVAQAFSRPTVLEHVNGRLDMWFSYRSGRGETYRIGRARSQNGTDWTLDLAGAGIAPSSEGWDSEMIEYPFVFRHAGAVYMLYNGNGYGRSGFGLAVWDADE
jgi:hypothetical protein